MNAKRTRFLPKRLAPSMRGISFEGVSTMHAIATPRPLALVGLLLGAFASSTAFAFNSGSTGADGPLSPTANIEVVLPPSGILNYTLINIPSGVTVTFRPNQLNTPVVLLVQGNATINGQLNVDGRNAPGSGTAGDGVLSDDGNPGAGGPGGFAGGRGGRPVGPIQATAVERAGGKGLGPGGGGGAVFASGLFSYMGGAGGGYSTVGGTNSAVGPVPGHTGGGTYGSNELLPLVGGSGGGGGGTSVDWSAGGGGGGGGALLLAVSGTLTISGSQARVSAIGGTGGAATFPACTAFNVSGGGGGSGGAIRLVATTLTGNFQGQIFAFGQGGGSDCWSGGAGGGSGRIRLEADNAINANQFQISPAATFGTPGPVFIPGLPSLKITTIAGAAVPDPPTGNNDVLLPANTPNPVTVAFATTGIPVGNIVRLSVTPHRGSEVTSVSTALTGTTQAATASAVISLPRGGSTVQASISYTVVAAVGSALARFTGDELVERITVTAGLDGRSVARLITVSGREFDAPPEAMRIAAAGV